MSIRSIQQTSKKDFLSKESEVGFTKVEYRKSKKQSDRYSTVLLFRNKLMPDRFSTVLDCIYNNFYEESLHFMKRRMQRDISIVEMKQILKTGVRKDEHWNQRKETWYYTIIGATFTGRNLTVVVHLNRNRTSVVFITAMDNRRNSPRPTVCPSERPKVSKRETKKPEERLSDPRCFSLASYIKNVPHVKTTKPQRV